jgi:hypothetical protein
MAYKNSSQIKRIRIMADLTGNNELTVGDKMSDGTIFAGVSPETNRPMFVLPKDLSLTMTFNEAQKYASKLNAHGHQDWRLPSVAELNILYTNKDKGFLKGTFNESGHDREGWYFASPKFLAYNDELHEQRFSDGCREWLLRSNQSSIRLVRS